MEIRSESGIRPGRDWSNLKKISAPSPFRLATDHPALRMMSSVVSKAAVDNWYPRRTAPPRAVALVPSNARSDHAWAARLRRKVGQLPNWMSRLPSIDGCSHT
jgi:hypothetical protein